MPQTLRTFIAVKLPEQPELQTVSRSLAEMRWPVAPVPPDKWHVTLKFLGETARAKLPLIQREINRAIQDQPPFEMRVEGLGAFPSAERPTVIWAGLSAAEPLARLAARLESALEPLGFARESRPFQPHLTLARIKGRPPSALAEMLQCHRETHFGSSMVRTLEFLQSELRSDGAIYSVLSRHDLA